MQGEREELAHKREEARKREVEKLQARREEERDRRDKEIKENKLKVKEVLKSDGHRLH
jgi:hypothetical protein